MASTPELLKGLQWGRGRLIAREYHEKHPEIASMSINIVARIEEWRSQLLDTSK
jgi:hypothetical protein